MTMRRRDALKTIGGLAGVATLGKFLPGCSDDGGPQGITTYVFLMMENRSYDHVLGARALEGLGGDGLRAGMSNPDLNGTRVAPFKAGDDHQKSTPTVCDIDPPHGWDASHLQFNSGAMDGFVTEHQKSHGNAATHTEPMKYLTRENQPVSWALADAYTSCDRWFCSVMGPTLPNRAYWHAGTSFGIKANNEVISKFGSGVPVPTIYNRLDAAGVDWAYYYGSLAVVSLLANPGPYQLDLGPMDGTGRVRRFGDSHLGGGKFFEDAAAGKLPPVVYIDPAFYTNDDHPPVHPIYGQELIGSIYTALAKSPQWKNIMFVVTYDENGGYFDHVPPPTTVDDTNAKYGIPGFEQMGFRVPTLVMGPYVKQGHVSPVVRDHTSVLKHLQVTFGLESINARIDAANDLSECIDEDRLARLDPAKPIALPNTNSEEWPTTAAACTSSEGFRTGGIDPISEAANERPELFLAPDLRGSEDVYLQSIRRNYHKNRV
ncbi:MAG: alkaline phosphatase family protein [Deltaproteobacteria bacterium]|nr:alkaline phosphatase family protein [Deltaproteobacteria bacterium]